MNTRIDTYPSQQFATFELSDVHSLLDFLLLVHAGAGYAYSEWIGAVHLSMFGEGVV